MVAVAFLLAAVALAGSTLLGAKTLERSGVGAAEDAPVLVAGDDVMTVPPWGSASRTPPSRMSRPITATMVLTARSEFPTEY